MLCKYRKCRQTVCFITTHVHDRCSMRMLPNIHVEFKHLAVCGIDEEPGSSAGTTPSPVTGRPGYECMYRHAARFNLPVPNTHLSDSHESI